MTINEKDTKLILELATFAAKAITQEASKEFFDRLNEVNHQTVARLDTAVHELSDINSKIVRTAQVVEDLSDRIAKTPTIPEVDNRINRVVSACDEKHGKDTRARTSLYIAIAAVLISLFDKLRAFFIS